MTSTEPLTDERLSEIEDDTHRACLCDKLQREDIPQLLAEVHRLRIQAAKSDELARDHWRESEAEFDRAAEAQNRASEVEAERDELRQRISNARAEIRKQDTAAAAGMRPGYCDVSDALAAVETHLVDPEHRPARHRGPGYPHELPDHAGPADTCAMPACVTARAQREAVADIQDLTHELFADDEPKAGA
ncbi:hypothetical protein [Actinocrinis sp.]|uniref:hypothetical protein n=1 Tax=Actinocrinis sp. TaxID=1920516 RepID=UPI002D501149|nr:hypothetical protein [Actinocrinis sp.]HZP54978.1 hypothetical protein [Actinocrinis sp.]